MSTLQDSHNIFRLDLVILVNVYVDLRLLPVLHRPEVVDIGVVLILHIKHAICLKDYGIKSFLVIRNAHGDSFKHLGIESSTDLDDRYSNLFLNAYINRHAHTVLSNSVPDFV